jgi:ribonuclease HI
MGNVTVLIDGASRNQGANTTKRAACAVVIFENRKEVQHFVRGLGDRTNNEAEYEALITALLICVNPDVAAPFIYSDSSVVVNHVNRKWQIKSPVLLPYYMTVNEIAQSYGFVLKEVPRNKVRLADQLCNMFLDQLEEEERRIMGSS